MFYERLSRQHGWALARRRRATRANARDWRGETKTLGPHRALIVTARGELRPNSNHQRRISHFEHHVTLTLAVCAVCHGLRCLCPRRHWLLVASPRRRRPRRASDNAAYTHPPPPAGLHTLHAAAPVVPAVHQGPRSSLPASSTLLSVTRHASRSLSSLSHLHSGSHCPCPLPCLASQL